MKITRQKPVEVKYTIELTQRELQYLTAAFGRCPFDHMKESRHCPKNASTVEQDSLYETLSKELDKQSY